MWIERSACLQHRYKVEACVVQRLAFERAHSLAPTGAACEYGRHGALHVPERRRRRWSAGTRERSCPRPGDGNLHRLTRPSTYLLAEHSRPEKRLKVGRGPPPAAGRPIEPPQVGRGGPARQMPSRSALAQITRREENSLNKTRSGSNGHSAALPPRRHRPELLIAEGTRHDSTICSMPSDGEPAAANDEISS